MDQIPIEHDVIIVGAGWAGLGVSYLLKQAGISHVVLERDQICHTWLTQRWNSFHMNTVNVATVLPGERYEGSQPEGFMTRDDFVSMVTGYAQRHALPVETGVEVECVRRADDKRADGRFPDDGFAVETSSGLYHAKAVVAATGNLNVPRRPAFSKNLPETINQIDVSDYRDPASLPAGAILVVGCGNSGGQIAEDLALGGRQVYQSTGRNGRVPRTYRGRDIYLWLEDTGMLSKPRTSSSGRGLIGATHTISLQSLSALGVTLLGRLDGLDTAGRLAIADSLQDSLAYGDGMSAALKAEIDAYITRTNLNAPDAIPEPAETVVPILPDPPIRTLDLADHNITTILWSTGFTGDFSWLRVPEALDQSGNPAQEKSLSTPGIYFAGLDTLESLKAGTVLMVKEEAQRIADHIIARLEA